MPCQLTPDLNTIDDDDIGPNVEQVLIDVGPEIINNEQSTNEKPYETFIASENSQPLQVDYIKETLNWPTANSTPINE